MPYEGYITCLHLQNLIGEPQCSSAGKLVTVVGDEYANPKVHRGRDTHMSQQGSKPTVLPVNRDSLSKVDRFFDSAEHIVERSEVLLSKSKPAVISLFLLLHLIIDLIVVLVVVLHRSG
jgi:hypothetical protein